LFDITHSYYPSTATLGNNGDKCVYISACCECELRGLCEKYVNGVKI